MSELDGSYVCAFRGRRDAYQVPAALAEVGRLEALVTDAYASPALRSLARLLPERLREQVLARSEPAVPDARVTSLWATAAAERTRRLLGASPASLYARYDAEFGRAAGRRAAKARANLLLYAPYADAAFTRPYAHTPRRVLFEYHPHGEVERRILEADLQAHPYVAHSSVEQTAAHVAPEVRSKVENAWRHADYVICASNFTRRTLVEVGLDETRCAVVPYGVEMPPDAEGQEVPHERFEVLFVGSGVQRKGLHHLLHAWRAARLPQESRLTIVSRHLDPGMLPLLRGTPRTEFLPGVTTSVLAKLYRRASLFAMPSLTEGFGQVYLEAMSHGCPVLGTPNSCVPDLGTAEQGVFLCRPGSIDDLIARLEELSVRLPDATHLRDAARSRAAQQPWSAFRAGIRAVL